MQYFFKDGWWVVWFLVDNAWDASFLVLWVVFTRVEIGGYIELTLMFASTVIFKSLSREFFFDLFNLLWFFHWRLTTHAFDRGQCFSLWGRIEGSVHQSHSFQQHQMIPCLHRSGFCLLVCLLFFFIFQGKIHNIKDWTYSFANVAAFNKTSFIMVNNIWQKKFDCACFNFLHNFCIDDSNTEKLVASFLKVSHPFEFLSFQWD